MMKTMFVAAPFGSFGLGDYAPPTFIGQAATSSGSAGDLLNVSQDIESLLKEVPPEALGSYQTEYKRCQDLLDKGGLVGLTSGGKCLYDLYAKLKDVIKNKPTAKPLLPALTPQSNFPVVAVAIGAFGVVALI